jgi:hypothetical protein
MKSLLIPIISGLIIALLLASPAAPAKAEFFTGNDLLARMKGTTMEQVQALGYVQGVVDAYSSVVICPPDNVTAGQVRDMIKNYLENLPAKRHFSADSLIGEALEKVWPCKQKRQGSPI